MKRRRFIKNGSASEEMTLQITSMADIFTIILVFLLKSSATGMASMAPTTDLLLPEAHAAPLTKETLKLEVSAEGVYLDSRQVAKLDHFGFAPGDIQALTGMDSLYQALLIERSRHGLGAEQTSLLILADQETPYSTLRPVLAAIAQAGFPDLDMVVVGTE